MKRIICNNAKSILLRRISAFLRLEILFPQPGYSGLNSSMIRGRMQRVFIGLVVLFGVGFMPAEGLDSLEINLLKQKIFYASDDLWIPPGLYDEPSGTGCCLFSFGAGLVGHEIYKSFKDTTRKEYNPKLSIGIGYSPGIAYRGVLSRLLESGEMDPFHQFYWNNQVHLDLSLPVTTIFFTKLSGSYIWARIEKTGTLFRPFDGHFCAGENKWEFRSSSFAISLGHYLKQNKAIQIEAGIEYYVWDGQDREIKAYTFEPVKIKNWGNGICGLVSMGFNKAITNRLIWNMGLSVRYSKGSQRGYSSSEAVEQLTPIVFHLTGFYIEFGIKYLFKKAQNGGAK